MNSRIKDFTARRNAGLRLAFLETLEVSSLEAELIRYERTLTYGGNQYEAQGDLVALVKLAPCKILVSFQSYKTGEYIAVFRIQDTDNDHANR